MLGGLVYLLVENQYIVRYLLTIVVVDVVIMVDIATANVIVVVMVTVDVMNSTLTIILVVEDVTGGRVCKSVSPWWPRWWKLSL